MKKQNDRSWTGKTAHFPFVFNYVEKNNNIDAEVLKSVFGMALGAKKTNRDRRLASVFCLYIQFYVGGASG